MTNVTSLVKAREERTPHMHGPCLCLDCRHEWQGVAPVGAVWLECPACSLKRGRFLFDVDYGETKRWTCNCGNDLFRITPSATYCPNCGQTQSGFQNG